ncbi:MAG: TetR/AcrR family transcriptional regulator [Anaerolineae bacterium]
MPYPPQVTPERILEQARALIASEGAAALSLGKLAAALGIKPPSLYRYFASKEALIRTLNEQTNAALFTALSSADAETLPLEERLLAIATAYRAFALNTPDAYVLAFTTVQLEMVPEPGEQEQRVLPYQALMSAWCGSEANSLTALRGLLAVMHGFVMLEISQQFRRSGGDLESGYLAVVRAYLAGARQNL